MSGPRLKRHARLRHDPVRGRTVLLSPERGLVLNASAAEIVSRLSGKLTVEQIALELGAPPDDVRALVDALRARGLVETTP
jgi:pyrroloquinoline quinone biosynthesis protein D